MPSTRNSVVVICVFLSWGVVTQSAQAEPLIPIVSAAPGKNTPAAQNQDVAKTNTASLLNSLILHYTFDESREDRVEPDESDQGNNAKIHGAVHRIDGVIGGAMQFDGTDDFLECGNDESLKFGVEDFTVALWFKTPLKDKLPYSYNPFINKGAAGSLNPARPGYGLYATIEHGKPILRWDFGQQSQRGRARVITDNWEANRWNHMALVRRGEAIEAYLNGARVTEHVQKATSKMSVSGSEPLLLGKVIGNNGSEYLYQGLMDDVRIYSRALSADEIATLHDDVVGQSVAYDPSRGTQPTEQGFRLLDNARAHADPRVINGVLQQGPTVAQAYQRWYTRSIPIDFSPEGKGVAVEWTARVKSSGLYEDRFRKKEWTGWGVQLKDKNGYTFDIYLGEDRVLLNRDDGNTPIATYKFDTTDRFHHYRFVIDDSQGMLFIDGDPKTVLTGNLGSPNQVRYSKPNEVAFGDCTNHALCEVHLKHFWYTNNLEVKSPFAEPLRTNEHHSSDLKVRPQSGN